MLFKDDIQKQGTACSKQDMLRILHEMIGTAVDMMSVDPHTMGCTKEQLLRAVETYCVDESMTWFKARGHALKYKTIV